MFSSIKMKVFGLVLMPLALIVLSIVGVVSFLSLQNSQENVKLFETFIYSDKKDSIKNEIFTMSTIIDGIVKKSNNIDKAKKSIIDIASSARFLNGSGYFFAYEKKGSDYYFAFHGTKPKLNGKKTNIMKPDIKGNIFRKQLIDSGNNDNKFVEYYYKKPNTNVIIKKVAFSKYIPALNWTLVTGVYVDNIKAKVSKIEKINDNNITSMITLIITIVGILLIVTIGIVSLLSNSLLLKPLLNLEKGIENFFKYLNKSTNNVSHIDVISKDEIGKMSRVINENIDKISRSLKEDNIFIEEVEKVMNKVEKGWFKDNINANTNNPLLIELKKTINYALNNIYNKFNEIDNILEEYSNYKYTKKLESNGIEKDGSLEKLINNINILRDSINEMLIENLNNGYSLTNSADDLLKNISTLNNVSNQAASNIEETATSLGQITSNISENTGKIVQMSNYANELTKSSSEGEKLAKQTTISMDEINEQVTAINEAITVIDQIAFQTNILSLNAAVEAATAGEAGKGFAVVAGEVRNLAARSSDAANEIKTLVENATTKANQGKDIADKMINGYSNLNNNITRTLDLIKDVESSSKEQQNGIIQINESVNSLDKQTQQNAIIANKAQTIANSTSSIANEIVSDTNKKEFIGKK